MVIIENVKRAYVWPVNYLLTVLDHLPKNFSVCQKDCSVKLVSNIADSAFTEKILGLPTENYKGYVEADATQRARNIPKKSFFLMHGLADLTAPYQHGVALARALAEAGILFRYQVRQQIGTHCITLALILFSPFHLQSYADEGHQLEGVIEHVYRSMQTFFEECLKLDTEEKMKEREEAKNREDAKK